MVRPAPIPRRSSHLGSAACYGRSDHGSHSSTSAASSRSKRRQGNHNRFQTLKMFPDGHLRITTLKKVADALGMPISHFRGQAEQKTSAFLDGGDIFAHNQQEI